MRFELHSSPGAVQFWSDVRLPFEPKGDAKQARAELRNALSALAPTGELSAEYASIDRGLCDVENVLLYNVGMAHFSGLGSSRIRLARSFSAPLRIPWRESPTPVSWSSRSTSFFRRTVRSDWVRR